MNQIDSNVRLTLDELCDEIHRVGRVHRLEKKGEKISGRTVRLLNSDELDSFTRLKANSDCEIELAIADSLGRATCERYRVALVEKSYWKAECMRVTMLVALA